jgi:hypothetical protein
VRRLAHPEARLVGESEEAEAHADLRVRRVGELGEPSIVGNVQPIGELDE